MLASENFTLDDSQVLSKIGRLIIHRMAPQAWKRTHGIFCLKDSDHSLSATQLQENWASCLEISIPSWLPFPYPQALISDHQPTGVKS